MYQSSNDLFNGIQSMLDTNEQSLVNRIPFFVNQAEGELDRVLRHPAAMQVLTSVVKAGSNLIQAPANMLEISSIKCRESGEMLYRRSYEMLMATPALGKYPDAFASLVNYFVLNKNQDKDITYEVVIYIQPTPLSPTHQTNMYLALMGDYLFYKACATGFMFLGIPDMSVGMEQRAQKILSDMIFQIEQESYQGSTFVQTLDVDRVNHYF